MTNVDLTGRWQSQDYDCPWGVKHTELIEIVHEGDALVATKITGDPCVPAGFETFRGRLPRAASVAAVVWTVGLPTAPASDTTAGFLEVVSENELRGGWPGYDSVMVFRRVGQRSNGAQLTEQAVSKTSFVKVANAR